MKELEDYKLAKQKLGQLFGTELYCDVVDCLDEYWATSYGDVQYSLKDEEFEDGFEVYGTSVWTTEEYTLITGYSNGSNKYHYIFSNDKKITDES